MAKQIAILLGAGASFGATTIMPTPPPLGGDLFTRLQSEYPKSWGSLATDVRAMFIANFETGMAAAWEQQLSNGSRLLIDMALFFTQFEPPTDRGDLYTDLVKVLAVRGMLRKSAFATLNYECVLDIAVSRLGLKVSYLAPAPPKGNVLIWKPHGACNLLPQAEVYNLSIIAQNIYEGGIQPHSPAEIRAKYAAGYALPPAMSLYAPGKPSPVAKSFVDQSRAQWTNWVQASDLIICIGVRPLLADTHIWDPIVASTARIWYIAGTTDQAFMDLAAAVGPRLDVIGTRFNDSAIGALSERLRAE